MKKIKMVYVQYSDKYIFINIYIFKFKIIYFLPNNLTIFNLKWVIKILKKN